MKKFLPLFLLFLVSFVCLATWFSGKTLAQIKQLPKAALKTSVEARVGEFYLNLEFYIAPNTSVVLTINGTFARSTVTDPKGYGYFTEVSVNKGVNHVCFDSVDVARNESLACFDINVDGSLTKKDIFLPPTLGLSRTEIAEGSSAKAHGYSMPGAKVTLYLSNGKVLTTYADPMTGYYEFTIKDLKAGIYSLYAKAELNHKQSLDPAKKLQLKSLSAWDQFIAFLKDLWNKLLKFLTNLSLGPLWLIIPILILIIILLGKLIGFNPFKKKRALHHKWWMGY
jgi:hypothetical protein